MRKFYPLFILTLMVILAACKVGDDDPKLTFRSRKARLVNKWVLVSHTIGGKEMKNDSWSLKLEFHKEGRFNYTLKDSRSNKITEFTYDKGTWNFTLAFKEYEDKECVALYSSENYYSKQFAIIELRNKKLRLKNIIVNNQLEPHEEWEYKQE